MGPMRRKRRRNNFRQKTNVNFTAILVIMCMAVLLGYGTAKFVIYPIFNSDEEKAPKFSLGNFLSLFTSEDDAGQNAEQAVTGSGIGEEPKNDANDGSGTNDVKITDDAQGSGGTGDAKIVEDQLSINKGNEVSAPVAQSGYCIQFGSFSTKLSAENLVSQLKAGGITSEIVEKDGAFKVVSQLFEQKDQAVATLNTLAVSGFADAFIVPR